MKKFEACSKISRLASQGLASFVLIATATSMSGCGKGSQSVAGLDNLHMDLLDGKLVVSFLTETLHINPGGTFDIPGLQDATLGINPDFQSKGTVLTFSFDLATLFKATSSGGASQGLPGGEPIPDISGGMLPEWNAKFESLNINLYLSSDVFGIFVPMNFLKTLPSTLSQNVNDSHGNLLGRVYAIPASGTGTESGVLMLVPYVSGTIH